MLHLGNDNRLDRHKLRRWNDLGGYRFEVDNRLDRVVNTDECTASRAETAARLHEHGTGDDNPCRRVEFHWASASCRGRSSSGNSRG